MYIKDGLLKFDQLKDSELDIFITYDNKIWGNMNPYFVKTEEEKADIKKKDIRLSQIAQVKTSFVLTTPPENTIMNLNEKAVQTLVNTESDEYQYIPLRTNAIIYKRQNSKKVAFIAAPSDCPLFVLTDESNSFVIIIHLGFPNVCQNIHIDTLNFARSLIPLENTKLSLYITPFICPDHYSISKTKFEKLSFFDNNFIKERYSKDFNETRFFIDFVGKAIVDLKDIMPGINIIQTGYCTFEEAQKGNLFSREYSQTQEARQKPSNWGSFNVIITI